MLSTSVYPRLKLNLKVQIRDPRSGWGWTKQLKRCRHVAKTVETTSRGSSFFTNQDSPITIMPHSCLQSAPKPGYWTLRDVQSAKHPAGWDLQGSAAVATIHRPRSVRQVAVLATTADSTPGILEHCLMLPGPCPEPLQSTF